MLFFSPPMQFNLNAAGGGATYNFALWGAGGAGGAGATDIAIGSDGGCGGSGAMIEFTAAGVPAGMQFELIRGGGGGAKFNSSNGGIGGGGGAASMIIATYNGTSVLLAVAGAGGGGGGTGGGGNTVSTFRGGVGGGGAEVDGSRNDGTDVEAVLGGHGGTSTTSGSTFSYVNPPAKETYAQDGGKGGQGGSTTVAGWTGDGKLPSGYESYGGAGGLSGNKSIADGGGGGAGGGYFAGSGGEGCHDPTDRRGGAGGGGGGSYLNSGAIDVGGASLVITLVQTLEGSFRTSSAQPALTQNTPATLFDGTTTAYGQAGDGGDKSVDVDPTDGQNGAIIYGTSAADAVTLYDATRLGYRDTFVV